MGGMEAQNQVLPDVRKRFACEMIGEKSMTTKDELYPTVKVEARLMDDGTLWIKSDRLTDINRVIVEDGKTYCKQFYQDANPEPCEDAVNRETILKFFDGWMSALDENCHNQSVSDLKIIKRDFANLPPVTPKQRTGKWIKLDMHRGMADHKCTACGQECYVPTCMGEPLYAFCPNCGSRNEVTDGDD